MPDTADPLTAALEDMRSRHYPVPHAIAPAGMARVCASDRHRWPCHAHILGNAVAAVLQLPGKWAEIDDGPSSALTEDRGWIRQECADDLREAITRELLGGGD